MQSSNPFHFFNILSSVTSSRAIYQYQPASFDKTYPKNPRKRYKREKFVVGLGKNAWRKHISSISEPKRCPQQIYKCQYPDLRSSDLVSRMPDRHYFDPRSALSYRRIALNWLLSLLKSPSSCSPTLSLRLLLGRSRRI